MGRMSQKTQLKVAELTGELARLSILVNMRCKEVVFLEVTGHVSWVELRICPSDNDYVTRLYDETAKFDRASGVQTIESMIKKLKEMLGE